MKTVSLALALSVVVGAGLGCDEKKEGAAASSATPAATASAPPPSTAAASAEPAAVGTASAPSAAASSAASMITGDAKDVVLTVRDPVKEPEKSITAQAGGSVTLFLPDHPGTVWSVDVSDRTLGKPKEEVIPGFAPGTNGHQFKWTTGGPLIKAGQKHKVTFVNKKAGDKAAKPTGTFALTIEIT